MAQRAVLLMWRPTFGFLRQFGPCLVAVGRNHSQLSPVSSRSRQDDPNSLKLTPEQLEVLKLAAQGENIFITGRAGTGKSVLIKEIIKQARRKGKEVAVTAPTGMAALMIGGKTIHSWAGLGIGNQSIDFYVDMAVRGLREWGRVEQTRQALLFTDLLIVDEVSMVCYSMHNAIDGMR
jgi:ATP-dependent DNA helicase PIF1